MFPGEILHLSRSRPTLLNIKNTSIKHQSLWHIYESIDNKVWVYGTRFQKIASGCLFSNLLYVFQCSLLEQIFNADFSIVPQEEDIKEEYGKLYFFFFVLR